MLIVGFKCDICGESVTRPWESGRPELPEGWARIRAEQPMEGKGEYIHDGTICPRCFKALFKGELPYDLYLQEALQGETLHIVEGGE